MHYILYQKTIVHASQAEDGETPTVVCLTEETNAYAVWLSGCNGTMLLSLFHKYHRDMAIERAVELASKPEHELFEMGWILS